MTFARLLLPLLVAMSALGCGEQQEVRARSMRHPLRGWREVVGGLADTASVTATGHVALVVVLSQSEPGWEAVVASEYTGGLGIGYINESLSMNLPMSIQGRLAPEQAVLGVRTGLYLLRCRAVPGAKELLDCHATWLGESHFTTEAHGVWALARELTAAE